jgi:hypothetical protein
LPTRAYVTFENEFSQQVMRLEGSAPLFGKESQFEPASEPSDINWENKICTDKNHERKRNMGLIGYLLLILMFNLFIQLYAQKVVERSTGKYEELACDQL